MLTFSSSHFLSQYAGKFPALSPRAAAGLESLLGCLQSDPDLDDPRHAAYMLATVMHECAATWQPIEEYGRGKGRSYGQPVTVCPPGGQPCTHVYYGRGYVQLTWDQNYLHVGQALGLGNELQLHPERALEPEIAYRILSLGMRKGLFTGKKLADYIHAGGCDYVNARRIINGTDQAAKIAGYASAFEAMLMR